MQKNTITKNSKNNIDFLKSSDNWKSLYDFNQNIDTSFFEKNKFLKDLKKVEDLMFSMVCDDS